MAISVYPLLSDPLVAALTELDLAGARVALIDGPGSGVMTVQRVLDAHRELQRQTRQGDLDGATMAAATALCRSLLRGGWAEPASPDQGARVPVVVTGPLGEEHLLDAEAAAVALRRDGCSVDVVCGDVTPEDLQGHLIRRGAHVLVVACAGPAGLPEVAAVLDAARSAGVPAVVTGSAFGTDDLRALRLGADAWAADLAAVIAVVDRWADDPPEPGPVAAPSEEYGRLRAKRFSLVAMVAHARAEHFGEGLDRTLPTLVAHLCAAVLVDDSRLLLEFLSGELGRVAGAPDDELVGLLEALAASVPPALVRSSAFLDDGRRHLRLALGRSGPMLAPVQLPTAQLPTTQLPAVPSGRLAEISEGQVFADLLLLGAMACQAPLALISVPRPGGQWSTLSFGAERRDQLNDPMLLEFLSGRREPVEIADLATHPVLSHCALADDPLRVRWVYGAPVRGPSEEVVAVFCALDRWPREVSRREQRAVSAVTRQLGVHFERLHRATAAPEQPRRAEPTGLVDRLAARRPAVPEGQQLLRSHEVAALFDVTERTVINWAAAGKLPALRTIGGHLRFRNDDVMALLADRRTGAARSG